ncbi:aspartate kinase [Pilibacter termitis]|uniref:Aspartokinase n=1 Tax=Pilibacter termitis TaxID=263852 RepID=A0A1T4MQ31_9ENTE|nr:aspartate kinase [Pilibacter termitis]SJZ69132.1 aspartate kinase [Pilibacter termitis]
MKVVKFGGSSVANAVQLEKVLDIVKSDEKRKIVIVSAPGKVTEADIKVTDLLIEYYDLYESEQDTTEIIEKIIQRYASMVEELQIEKSVLEDIATSIKGLATLERGDNPYLRDTFLSAGEDNSAKLIAVFFQSRGVKSRYISPKEAGLIVTSEPSNARVLESSYANLAKLKNFEEVLVIPGFFGVTETGNVCTFSRGGSDVTGSILAAGVEAELYENFTDVDGIFAAHPGVVHEPMSIQELTYKEMRELAYAGFTVIHDEALFPVYQAKIPVVIKNTNNPTHAGTKILASRTEKELAVVGIAGDDGFASLNISKYLMNRELGFGRKVLEILEKFDISFEHMPSGIDDISVIMRERYLTEEKEQLILEEIKKVLAPDEIYFEHNLSILMIVGEGMREKIGVTAKGTTALSKRGINLELINQGSSEVSVMFGIKSDKEKAAIRALYETYFN